MSARRIIAMFALMGVAFAPFARASYNFNWHPPSSVAAGTQYTVAVDVFYAGSAGGYIGYITRSGSHIYGWGGSAYSWATASVPQNDSTPGTATFLAEATSYQGEYSSSAHTVTVTGNPPTVNAISASCTYNSGTSFNASGSNVTTWSASGLPAGLSISSTTGVISGTPTAVPNTYTATITGTNSSGSASNTATVTVAKANFSPPNPPAAATVNVGTGWTPTITGGNPSAGTVFCVSGVTNWQQTPWTPGAGNGGHSYSYYVANLASATYYNGPTDPNWPGSAFAISGPATITVNQPPPPPPSISSSTSAAGTYGSSFSYTITALNNPTSYGASGLPPGLGINTSSGVISGTPTSAGSWSATISATNSGGTGSATLSIAIGKANQASTGISPTSQTITAGQSITFSASGGSGTGAYTWGGDASGTGGSIPVTFNTVGTRTVNVTRAGDANYITSNTATATITVNAIVNAPVVSGGSASGTINSAFSYQISGTNSPTSYGASGLPPGLGVNTSSGVISGTPTSAGSWSATISATNSGGTGSATLSITIAKMIQSTVTISPTSQTITAGQSITFMAGGGSGTGAYTWGGDASGTGGSMPVTFNIVGTRTVNVYRATDSTYVQSNTATATITVNSAPVPVITSATTATGTVGSAFSYQITASNSPTSYAATNLAGTGLTLNTSTGVISGNPTSTGTISSSLTASNGGGASAPVVLTITISASGPLPDDNSHNQLNIHIP